MTRVAIVAGSEELRTRLAAALAAHPSFEILTVSDSIGDAAPSADVILVARPHPAPPTRVRLAPDDAVANPVLTGREQQVLALVAEGLGNKQIAARLGISSNTVKTHLEVVFEKLGVSSRAEAVAISVRRGLLLL